MQLNRQDYGLLIAIGAVWGSSFLLIKWAVQSIPLVTVATGQIAIGAIVLLLIVAVRGHRWPRASWVWLLLAIMRLFGNVIPFTLINWGEVRIDCSLTAILIHSVFLAPAFLRDEPITTDKIIGVVLGMAGVAALIGATAPGWIRTRMANSGCGAKRNSTGPSPESRTAGTNSDQAAGPPLKPVTGICPEPKLWPAMPT